MAGLDPAIHPLRKTLQEGWMRGSSTRMTKNCDRYGPGSAARKQPWAKPTGRANARAVERAHHRAWIENGGHGAKSAPLPTLRACVICQRIGAALCSGFQANCWMKHRTDILHLGLMLAALGIAYLVPIELL
jgi:hypothetical protein